MPTEDPLALARLADPLWDRAQQEIEDADDLGAESPLTPEQLIERLRTLWREGKLTPAEDRGPKQLALSFSLRMLEAKAEVQRCRELRDLYERRKRVMERTIDSCREWIAEILYQAVERGEAKEPKVSIKDPDNRVGLSIYCRETRPSYRAVAPELAPRKLWQLQARLRYQELVDTAKEALGPVARELGWTGAAKQQVWGAVEKILAHICQKSRIEIPASDLLAYIEQEMAGEIPEWVEVSPGTERVTIRDMTRGIERVTGGKP